MDYYRCAKSSSLSLFHQCKAWSSAVRRHTRSGSALVVGEGGNRYFANVLCHMHFYPNFLEAGFPAGSQYGPGSVVAKCYSLVHL